MNEPSRHEVNSGFLAGLVGDFFREEPEGYEGGVELFDAWEVEQRETARRAALSQERFELGKFPNARTGFYHTHSASYECGIAYRVSDPSGWMPCKRLVNHEGGCGYEDNTCY